MSQHREREKARVPAETIIDYLGGLSFPCAKERIVRLAVAQGAPESVVSALERLPDEPFSSFDDIMRHFGRAIG